MFGITNLRNTEPHPNIHAHMHKETSYFLIILNMLCSVLVLLRWIIYIMQPLWVKISKSEKDRTNELVTSIIQTPIPINPSSCSIISHLETTIFPVTFVKCDKSGAHHIRKEAPKSIPVPVNRTKRRTRTAFTLYTEKVRHAHKCDKNLPCC